MTDKRQELDLTAAILAYYDRHKRKLPWRDTANPYYIWLSEIMLQQTRVEAVKGYFARFIAELPDINALAACEEERLLKLWEGLGYYSRVRNLKKAAGQVMAEYGGHLPETKTELLTLAGIGDYTAAAIAAIAFERQEVALDGNLIRVFSRLWALEEDFSRQVAKHQLRDRIAAYLPEHRAGDFNQAVMDIGALICLPNGQPLCGQCPLAEFCQARAAGETMRYPLKKEKKSRKIEQRTILIIQQDEIVMLCRRGEKGVLAGLWEFPALAGHCGSEEVRQQLAEEFSVIAAVTAEIEVLPPAKHIFSHLEWEMTAYWIRLPDRGIVTECSAGFADTTDSEKGNPFVASGESCSVLLDGEKTLAVAEPMNAVYSMQMGRTAKKEAADSSQVGEAAKMTVGYRSQMEDMVEQSLEWAGQPAIWADSRKIRQELSLPSAFKPYQQEVLKRLEQENGVLIEQPAGKTGQEQSVQQKGKQ